jgi:hypothetical protein
MKKTEGPTCFECSHYPDADREGPERDWGRSRSSSGPPFYCPQIKKRVAPGFASHCPEFLPVADDDRP